MTEFGSVVSAFAMLAVALVIVIVLLLGDRTMMTATVKFLSREMAGMQLEIKELRSEIAVFHVLLRQILDGDK